MAAMNGLSLEHVHPVLTLFGIVGVGLAFGRISIRGLNLGSSGVLFAALVAGHFGAKTYVGVGTIGLVLFVYAVGVGAGGRFFSALRRDGSTLAQLGLLITVSGAAVVVVASWLFEVPADLTAGIFAGALTSTPALAAATETLKGAGELVPIGYGIAYPFGVVGVVLFVQLLPRVLKIDLSSDEGEAESESDQDKIVSTLIEVTNTDLTGTRIADFEELAALGVQVTRVRQGERGVPLSYDDVFATGQDILLVGRERQIRLAVKMLGRPSDHAFIRDVERERRQLIILERRFTETPLHDLNWLRDYGATVSRITRLGVTFVPDANTQLDVNDVVTVVGDPARLEKLAIAVGHRSQAFDETDLLSLGVGLSVGVIVGKLSLSLPGVGAISLGLAGGPLLVGLILGHFGRVGRIVGHLPRPTRLMLQELGLVLFLAEAGLQGGGAFLETVRQHGPVLFLVGALTTLIPMAVAFAAARSIFKLSLLRALGGICGGMTSTPALGAITAKTDSQQPVVSYATAYPVALILMTVFAKIVIQLVTMLST